MKKSLLFCALTLGLSSHLFATDLMDIYHEALENDPIFKDAYDTYMSTTEAVPQARAALFPQVTIAGQVGRNIQDVSGGGTGNQFGVHSTYNSNLWQLTASQAIFNYQAWSKVAQAKASVKAAQATFNDAAQDLILRTSKAYFDVLFAKDTLEFAEAKKTRQ